MSDVSTGYREFLLEPGCPVLKLHRVDDEGQQWLPETPAKWMFKVQGFPWRIMIVWGDAINRLVCSICDDTPEADVPVGAYKSIRQLPAGIRWQWDRRLVPDDLLPTPFGPTLSDYIARLEAGKGETE